MSIDTDPTKAEGGSAAKYCGPVIFRLGLMRNAAVGIALAIFALNAAAGECTASREISYEPTVVELTGKVRMARGRHPNGTWMTYPVMRLTRPVSVKADGVNSINSTEPCISEVQLITSDPSLNRRLSASRKVRMVVRGTVFHEHTAWHMRKLVMTVTEVRT